ncbi:MAG: transcription-repair coupling factor [Ilumatobacter sp.]|uniref:transcription-repair coupling factor n=1 Tax=Ilumatobacter sp. TaxID=1967498 RepID=UPI002629DC2E|nr:transcription-repair coupling factor [Ilumatobacter sp.]MDJ0768852.1 transcription-repair coupling factor [Ilumatobacter sp.]
MTLASLPPLLRDEPGLTRALGEPGARLAVVEVARPISIAALAHLSGRSPLVVACPTGAMAGQLYDDLRQYVGGDDVALFPAWETLPFERVSPAVETMGQRLEVLWRLRQGAEPDRAAGSSSAATSCPKVIVAGVRALLQRLGPGAVDVEPIIVRPDAIIDPDQLTAQLVEFGYRREELVEHRGEFARRGAIVDVFPSTADAPIRIDLWGDEVDRLTVFGVNDQRSTGDIDQATIFPARELMPTDDVRERAASLVATEPWGREQWERLAEGTHFEGMESWVPWLVDDDTLITDVLPEQAKVLLVEPRRMRDRAIDLLAEEDDLAKALASTWARDPDKAFPRLHADVDRLLSSSATGSFWTIDSSPDSPDTPVVQASGWGPVGADGSGLSNRLIDLIGQGYSVTVAADGAGSATRLHEILLEQGLDFPVVGTTDIEPPLELASPGGRIVVAPLHRGCTIPNAKVAIVAESDLTGRRRAHRKARPRRREGTTTFEDLHAGNYVVHHMHGVGKYEGMVKRSIGGVERDYLLVAYKGGDKLYVPSDQIDTLRQYVGGEAPTLHRLGGSDFAKAKGRVRSAVREIAQELVVLYQKRVNAEGHAFGHDTPWQREMEDAFPYVETPDQRTAIDDLKGDMERPFPMDRLICGDVGFGKTEVAIRGAFKAIQEGKQVAVLAPTTLLASQHGNTFADRFAGYPIRVEVLSRFLTAAQAKQVMQGLRDGEVDCVIGTHRLLAADVTFKDLGLLIVDEEQRFGVQHKEQIKKLKTNVDVLTLSATPIPRTLEMSLVGIRDLSLLQTPPADRQPILTYVGGYDERVAVEAIRRELLREGQVFWVHNRVRSIDTAAARLRQLVPEARIAVAHGRMDEGTLEQVVVDFWEGRYDVLVCTTIIESGIDMPTVNTLVVERADLLGLGQMHQLRGRVGRSGSRAYAYLFHPEDTVLSEEAYERLKTIGEATDLGSGFKIAMRDLEIRGAGNLLGQAQSGHIAAVGYDLYCQMVTEAVAEMKGEPIPTPSEIKLDVPSDAFLPVDYVSKEELRLEAYRRLAEVTSHGAVDDIRTEWEDRYGPLPEPAEALLMVGRLRAECNRLGIVDLQITENQARLAPLELKLSAATRLKRIAKGAIHKEELRQLVVPIPRGQDAATFLVGFLQELIPEGAA